MYPGGMQMQHPGMQMQQPGMKFCYDNFGHQMQWLNSSPYPGDLPACDACSQIIQHGLTFAHCDPCGVDLCYNCSIPRVR